MAIEEKRSLGTWCKWLGVLVISGLGIVAVPKAKILRASEAITLTLEGRADFQVKVQGYRIELGEIEAAMMDYDFVETAIVVAAGERHGRYLVGYVVPLEGSEAKDEAKVAESKVESKAAAVLG